MNNRRTFIKDSVAIIGIGAHTGRTLLLPEEHKTVCPVLLVARSLEEEVDIGSLLALFRHERRISLAIFDIEHAEATHQLSLQAQFAQQLIDKVLQSMEEYKLLTERIVVTESSSARNDIPMLPPSLPCPKPVLKRQHPLARSDFIALKLRAIFCGRICA